MNSMLSNGPYVMLLLAKCQTLRMLESSAIPTITINATVDRASIITLYHEDEAGQRCGNDCGIVIV
uniref:Uncharacterized protein n=1 Tax=Pristionchus pacificus TaxID=54126 RepID=A0A2A6B731_PRIPA|eukprot:PDM61674.1 hypothetical protein PRIPAC_51116 [Pristionchus pacificus]